MSRFKPKHDDTSDALANFALTFAKAMLVLSVILVVLINPSKKEEDGIKPKIEYMVQINWPDGDDDVDLWMRTPDNKIVYYGNKEANFLTLERDSMGTKNNTIIVDGKTIVNTHNEEFVSVRGIEPGEYVITIHLYRSHETSEWHKELEIQIPVEIKIIKFNPKVTEVFKTIMIIHQVSEE